jgi:hypothetical protein
MKQEITTGTTVVAGQEQVSTDLTGEVVILNLHNGEYYGLNEVGARIWSLIQEPRTVGDLCKVLLEEYTEIEPVQCESEVVALLEEMAQANLVEIVVPADT